MHLNLFPSEILGLILGNACSSYHIVRLWKCGNRLLNSKLVNGITFLDLESDSTLTRRMPRLVLELRHLQHLSLSSLGTLIGDADVWCETIEKLPSCLKSLQLKLNSAELGLWMARMTKRRSISYPRRNYLDQLFPQLETLTFDFSDGSSAATEFPLPCLLI